jgi:hypothetical protein
MRMTWAVMYVLSEEQSHATSPLSCSNNWN